MSCISYSWRRCKIKKKPFLLLVSDLHRVGVPHGVGVVGKHLLRAVVGRRVEVLLVCTVVVALGDDAAAHGRLVVGLEVDVVDVALELHRQRPGRPGVDKARPEACRSEDVMFTVRVVIVSCHIHELL